MIGLRALLSILSPEKFLRLLSWVWSKIIEQSLLLEELKTILSVFNIDEAPPT